MLGRDGEDPLFLQFKEAQPSVLEPFLGKSEFANSGQRVVEGQRLTQAASDIMLGWIKIEGVDGVRARLLHPPALGLEDVGSGRVMSPKALTALRRVCGAELARAHARVGRRRSRSRAISARVTPSIARWRTFAEIVRRPERARLRGAQGGGRSGPGQRRVRRLIEARALGDARLGSMP